jgi:AraC-like DNA-binding protein
MGVTMTEHLNRVRLEYALSMIQNTDKNILTIAQELGFSSISYFNVSFKKKYGISPIKARKYK